MILIIVFIVYITVNIIASQIIWKKIILQSATRSIETRQL